LQVTVAASAAEAATSHRHCLSVHIKVRDGYEKSPKRIAKQPQNALEYESRNMSESIQIIQVYWRKQSLCMPHKIADRWNCRESGTVVVPNPKKIKSVNCIFWG